VTVRITERRSAHGESVITGTVPVTEEQAAQIDAAPAAFTRWVNDQFIADMQAMFERDARRYGL
jgi:hypothetical protein